jgi:hypothetical protein
MEAIVKINCSENDLIIPSPPAGEGEGSWVGFSSFVDHLSLLTNYFAIPQ